MRRIFKRVSAGASLGYTIGGTFRALLIGVAIALPSINIISASMVAAVATITVSSVAAGTLVRLRQVPSVVFLRNQRGSETLTQVFERRYLL